MVVGVRGATTHPNFLKYPVLVKTEIVGTHNFFFKIGNSLWELCRKIATSAPLTFFPNATA